MQYLSLLLFVAACQGLAVQKVKKLSLPQPELLALTVQDPLYFKVEWKPVKNDEREPIVGYKVIVWELPPTETFKYVTEDGVHKLVEEISQPKINEAETRPEKDAKTIVVLGPTVDKAPVFNIKLNAVYEVRVRAFSRTQDGPLSTHMRVQVLGDEAPKKTHDRDVSNFV